MKTINPTSIFIASLESVFKVPHFANKIQKSNHQFYLTNKYSQTLWANQSMVQAVRKIKNVKVIQNFQSAVHKIQKSSDKLILIIGDPHHHLHEKIKGKKFITLEQLCAVFPEKVPLSYRSRNIQKLRQKLQNRLQLQLDNQPEIQNVLITSHDIKMWDEAIQVLLDLHPADIIVEYEVYKQKQQYHGVSLQDFLAAMKTCHQLIIPKLPIKKTQRQAKIIDFNDNNLHLKWIIQHFGLNKNSSDHTQLIEDQLLDGKNLIEGFRHAKLNEVII